MTFEIAIATMRKTKAQCLEMLNMENIHCDCIIVNQCEVDDYAEEFIGNQHVRIFFTKERGLSKSRNMALRNMKADVMAIGDDDLYYYDDFEKKILSYYELNPKADVVLFNFDDCYKKYPNKSRKCFFIELTGYKSVQMTFTKKINEQKFFFNEYFGTGSKYVQSGEENVFLSDLWHNGKRIFYCKEKIIKREVTESSWFKGYTETYFKDRGAVYYAVSHFLYYPYILRFVIKMHNLMKPLHITRVLYLMQTGKNEYKQYLKQQRKI